MKACTRCGKPVRAIRWLFGSRVCTTCEPVMCTNCGKPVEEGREVYATPLCHTCLPPPEPLPINHPAPPKRSS